MSYKLIIFVADYRSLHCVAQSKLKLCNAFVSKHVYETITAVTNNNCSLVKVYSCTEFYSS